MKCITAVIVGFGDRSEIYSKFSLKEPEMLKIVGVVEPNKIRREYAKKLYNLSEDYCFDDYERFISRGKIADCVINGTMDNMHIKTTMPLLPLKYDVLLEKPITSDRNELIRLLETAKIYGNKIIVCHVLRYTPFYLGIRRIISNGSIGDVRHIESSENVGVAHASVSYIRGKWNNQKRCGSSYLLAKCCHDFDLICWLNNTTKPKIISSLGGRDYFIETNAPQGSGNRCLVDCSIENTCPYSARKMHVDNNPLPLIVWKGIDKMPEDITLEEKINSLETDNPHGECIFKTDADVVDQQMTIMKFANGSTAYHNLFSSATRAGRRIMVYGTMGEIEGFSEESKFVIRRYTPKDTLYTEEVININDDISGDNHYGGDSRIMYDFVKVMNGIESSLSTSKLEDSVYSHLCVFTADDSMTQGKTLSIEELI